MEIAQQQFDVFLSHNSQDKDQVRSLKDRLVNDYRLSVWFDEEQARPGTLSVDLLQEGIKNSKSVVVVIGKNGLGKWEAREFSIAIKLAVEQARTVITALLGEVDVNAVPLFLTDTTYVRFKDGFNEAEMNRLYWGITGQKFRSGLTSQEISVVTVDAAPVVQVPAAATVQSLRDTAETARKETSREIPVVDDSAGRGDVVAVPTSSLTTVEFSTMDSIEFTGGFDPHYWKRTELPVRLLVACKSPELMQRLNSFRAEFDRSIPVFDELRNLDNFKTNESYLFDWRATTPSRLLQDIHELQHQDQIRLVTIVSDSLADVDAKGVPQPAELVQKIRSGFLSRPYHCGLLALMAGDAHRVRDVDAAISLSSVNRALLRQRITKIADGLRMKSPPGLPMAMAADDAIIVRLARNDADLEKCLELRYQVYDRMGYLEDELANAGCELDCYDSSAFHLMACTRHGDVVGTVRLILARRLAPNECPNSIVGPSPAETMNRQAASVRRVAQQRGAILLMKMNRPPYFATLPILQSAEFNENFQGIMTEVQKSAELSRLVIAPRFRGVGLSKLLSRAVIAIAINLKIRQLLLECVPGHVGMYESLGFEQIPGTHGRAQELDQEAVGMRLDLQTPTQNSRACGQAMRDLKMVQDGFGRQDPLMMFGTKHLCMCSQTGCWSAGRFHRASMPDCPMRDQDR